MFNFINNIFDKKNEENHLEEQLKNYKKIRNITGFLILSIITMIALIILTIHLANSPKEVQAIMVNESINREKPIQLSYQPSFSNEKMNTYVKKVITDMFTMNLTNAERKSETFEKYFTPLAWLVYKDKVGKEFVDFIVSNGLIATATFVDKPLLVNYAEYSDGSKKWKYNGKVFITYTGSLKDNEEKYSINEINIILQTAKLTDNPNGVLIDNLNMYKTGEN